MENSNRSSDKTTREEGGSNLPPDQVVEIWKHFANTGGTDKERMVTIVTWLLLLSVTAIGYGVTEFIEFQWPLDVKKSKVGAAAALAILGFFVSFAGILVVLLFFVLYKEK